MKYQLTVTRKQLEVIGKITELYSRLCMGQMGELRECRKDFFLQYDRATGVQQIVFPDLNPNQMYGINSPEIPEGARIAWDIYQVIRHFLAWENEHNTPATRQWPEQFGVCYDDPMKTGSEPFAAINHFKEEKGEI